MPLTSESEWAERICLDPSQSLWDTGGAEGESACDPTAGPHRRRRAPATARPCGEHSVRHAWGSAAPGSPRARPAWAFVNSPLVGEPRPALFTGTDATPLLLTVDAGP